MTKRAALPPDRGNAEKALQPAPGARLLLGAVAAAALILIAGRAGAQQFSWDDPVPVAGRLHQPRRLRAVLRERRGPDGRPPGHHPGAGGNPRRLQRDPRCGRLRHSRRPTERPGVLGGEGRRLRHAVGVPRRLRERLPDADVVRVRRRQGAGARALRPLQPVLHRLGLARHGVDSVEEAAALGRRPQGGEDAHPRGAESGDLQAHRRRPGQHSRKRGSTPPSTAASSTPPTGGPWG